MRRQWLHHVLLLRVARLKNDLVPSTAVPQSGHCSNTMQGGGGEACTQTLSCLPLETSQTSSPMPPAFPSSASPSLLLCGCSDLPTPLTNRGGQPASSAPVISRHLRWKACGSLATSTATLARELFQTVWFHLGRLPYHCALPRVRSRPRLIHCFA